LLKNSRKEVDNSLSVQQINIESAKNHGPSRLKRRTTEDDHDSPFDYAAEDLSKLEIKLNNPSFIDKMILASVKAYYNLKLKCEERDLIIAAAAANRLPEQGDLTDFDLAVALDSYTKANKYGGQGSLTLDEQGKTHKVTATMNGGLLVQQLGYL
jgi:hypothetical protein